MKKKTIDGRKRVDRRKGRELKEGNASTEELRKKNARIQESGESGRGET